MSVKITQCDIFSVVHIAPPDKVREVNYDELLSFQIIFNAFHTIYRFGDTFSTVALCLRIYGTGELDHAIGGFNFHMTGRDNVICQQFGFDFTGSGGVTRVGLFTEPSLASRTCSLSLTEVTPSTPFATFTASSA